MQFNIRICGIAAATLFLLATPAAYAQDFSLTSYQDLLVRVSQLEGEVAASRSSGTTAETTVVTDCGGNGCGDSCCSTCCARFGLFVQYENVIVTPFFSTNTAFIAFGTADDDTIFNEQFDWDLEYSPRMELGYLFQGTNVGWRARYWHFEHSTGLRMLNAGPDRIHVEPHDNPNVGFEVSVGDIVEVEHAIDLNVVDLEAIGRTTSPRGSITGSAGVRYVRMEQKLVGNDIDGMTGGLINTIEYRHNFEGAGPTFAIEGLRRIGSSNVGLFADLRGSVLYGSSEVFGVDRSVPSPGLIDELFLLRNRHDLMAVGEVQLGVDYRVYLSGGRSFFVRTAGEFQYWASGGSANGQHADSQDRTPATETDMGFVGLSVGTGVDF